MNIAPGSLLLYQEIVRFELWPNIHQYQLVIGKRYTY